MDTRTVSSPPIAAEPNHISGHWRRTLAGLLAAAAALPLLGLAWWPLFDVAPGDGMRLLLTLAAAVAMAGAAAIWQSRTSSFPLLWAALGAIAALTTVGIFSLGFAIAPAVPLLIAAITVAPDRSRGPARLGWATAAAFAIGYAAMFLPLLLAAPMLSH